MTRQPSSSVSDAVLCATAAYCSITMYYDTPRHPLADVIAQDKAGLGYGHYHPAADDVAEPLSSSLLTTFLPSSLQLTSLSSLVVYGYFFLALASAAGTLRFAGKLPSIFVRLHTLLTHVATLLTIPSFALALLPLANPSMTRAATSTFLPQAPPTATSPSLPLASFFTMSLSCLLLFPQLFRHLPRPISLDTSAKAVSTTATALLLYSAMLLSRSTVAGWWLLSGALPLLLSSALMAVVPNSSWGVGRGIARLCAVDVFHYAFSITCLVWLHAFRLLLSHQATVA